MIDRRGDLIEKQSNQLAYSLYDDNLLSNLKQRFTLYYFFGLYKKNIVFQQITAYSYNQSTKIICFNELIVFLNLKSNIKSFLVNNKKKAENF